MNLNRIFCIGKNYAEHVAELAHLGRGGAGDTVSAQQRVRSAATSPREDTVTAPDSECVVFMKPASCVVPLGEPIPLPKGRGEIHHEAELVVLLTGGGADIEVREALDYVAAITLGLDLTLRDLQTQLKQAGKPWELSKSFDGAAPLGDWKPWLEEDLQALEFTLHVNGALRQHGRTRDMLYPVAQQISILSKTWALLPGDVIYTGTPKGVAALRPGDRAVLESASIGRFEWTCA